MISPKAREEPLMLEVPKVFTEALGKRSNDGVSKQRIELNKV